MPVCPRILGFKFLFQNNPVEKAVNGRAACIGYRCDTVEG